MRIYHSPQTRSTRVVWTLEEIGEPYDVTILTREERQADAHRKLHPLGRVPVLEHGQGILLESSAQCLHLADVHPEAKLVWPIGSRERALVYQWLFFGMLELEMPIIDVMRYREEQPPLAEAATERFTACAALVERALDGHEYLVGDRFSVADIVTGGGVLGFARHMGLVDDFPRIGAYVDRLDARPARQRALAVGTS